MNMFVKELTRESLWRTFRDHRFLATPGDHIDAQLFVDDAWIESHVHSPREQCMLHGELKDETQERNVDVYRL